MHAEGRQYFSSKCGRPDSLFLIYQKLPLHSRIAPGMVIQNERIILRKFLVELNFTTVACDFKKIAKSQILMSLVGILKERCSFFQTDAYIFMGFLALEEQLKMLGYSCHRPTIIFYKQVSTGVFYEISQ